MMFNLALCAHFSMCVCVCVFVHVRACEYMRVCTCIQCYK